MIHQVVTRVSMESFREKSHGKKIVLLYPWTTYRTLFLGHFLSHSGDGLLYYRLPNDEMTLKNWLSDIANELGQIVGRFGDYIRSTLDVGNARSLGEAMASDLNAYNNGETVLFIDEFDRLEFNDDFKKFILALVSKLDDGVQIVFSSRLLTYLPWYELVADGQAVVLGTEYRKNDVMFTVENEPAPQLEVYGFGRGHAIVDGQEIANWDGALPRNLFFYFIDNPLVTRDDIFDTFWPALSVKEATNVFHVTKRKISERITMKVEEPGNYELTQYAGGFYMPSNKVVRHYDVDDFQEAVEQAATSFDPEEEEMLYRQAIDLYKAPFLETIEMEWVKERRRHLRELYTQALVGLGRIHQRRGENEEALGLFVRAAKETPEREDIHREIIARYAELGMVDDAKQHYGTLEEILRARGAGPSKQTLALREQLDAVG